MRIAMTQQIAIEKKKKRVGLILATNLQGTMFNLTKSIHYRSCRPSYFHIQTVVHAKISFSLCSTLIIPMCGDSSAPISHSLRLQTQINKKFRFPTLFMFTKVSLLVKRRNKIFTMLRENWKNCWKRRISLPTMNLCEYNETFECVIGT